MFCRKCGTQLPDDSVFCTKCGLKVDDAPTVKESTEELSPVDKWLDTAQKKFADGDYDSALNYAERVIEVEPENFTARDMLFRCLIDKSGASAASFKKYFKDAVEHAVVAAKFSSTQASN